MELGVCSYCKVPFADLSEIYLAEMGAIQKHKHCGPTYPVPKMNNDKVAAETARCVQIVRNMQDVYAGHTDDNIIAVGNLRRLCEQIIREINGWT